jgi:anti-sigma factor RsiW
MNETTNSPVCERAEDLMAFLYREMDDNETRAFEVHLRECANCRDELASFGVVRESIFAWREEALSGFVSTPLPAKKSALAALRQFFDLSPLWLKAATGFAVVTFCVLLGWSIAGNKKEPAVAVNTGATYTQQEVDRLLADALAKQQPQPPSKAPEPVVVMAKPPRQKSPIRRATKDRRPLSRAEREQLAADLRLMPDEDDLDLLDRINR